MHRKKSKVPFAFILVFLAAAALAGGAAFLWLPIPAKWQSITFFGCWTLFMFAGIFTVSYIKKKRG